VYNSGPQELSITVRGGFATKEFMAFGAWTRGTTQSNLQIYQIPWSGFPTKVTPRSLTIAGAKDISSNVVVIGQSIFTVIDYGRDYYPQLFLVKIQT
jgi:hypothetical protein